MERHYPCRQTVLDPYTCGGFITCRWVVRGNLETDSLRIATPLIFGKCRLYYFQLTRFQLREKQKTTYRSFLTRSIKIKTRPFSSTPLEREPMEDTWTVIMFR